MEIIISGVDQTSPDGTCHYLDPAVIEVLSLVVPYNSVVHHSSSKSYRVCCLLLAYRQ